MEFNSDFFLDNKKLLEAKDKTWFLFGMGEDFEALLSTLSDCLCIKGGFDNNITSKEYMGYAILPIELCTRDYVRKHILITTSKYYEAVSAQLQKHGLIPGVDFFVWDRWNR